MTPTVPEILRGNFTALATPPAAETGGEYLASRIGVVALLNLLAAQEVEAGEGAALTENAAIAALLGDAAIAGYPAAVPAAGACLSSAERDRHNASLRRALIEVHEAVELAGDRALDRRILALYRDMAAGRRLVLPPM